MHRVLDSFIIENFPGLELSPGLISSWSSRLCFGISPPGFNSDDPESLGQAYQRAAQLFHKVFHSEDELLLVAVVQPPGNESVLGRKYLNIYLKYVKRKNTVHRLQHFLKMAEGKDMKEHRLIIPCRKEDIHYLQLIENILYEHFAHPSTILKYPPQNSHDIYFINYTNKIIYHLYEDRRCEILAADKEQLRPLYDEFNSWILENDRESAESLFNDFPK
ncbi:DUF3885 domain-containing protein [Bacillus sp. FJAT-27251]|uniref:DUF3885 domain-containing protein n=1 Tax=Bacillus sp. FJAT-27251 TaxID=1684142 RepID=UPI0006A7CE21|nr:DUF3885 domain-containing protein [Bacillus sp. FJAT-27251]